MEQHLKGFGICFLAVLLISLISFVNARLGTLTYNTLGVWGLVAYIILAAFVVYSLTAIIVLRRK